MFFVLNVRMNTIQGLKFEYISLNNYRPKKLLRELSNLCGMLGDGLVFPSIVSVIHERKGIVLV